MLLSRQFGGFFAALLLVLSLEFIYAARGIHKLLFAREERVAAGADFDANVAFMRGGRVERVLARTYDVHLVVVRVYSRFHIFDLSGKFYFSTKAAKPPRAVAWLAGVL